jgi:hypothetical protein
MCRHNKKQLQFENFEIMVGGKLRSDNRRVKLVKQIPWEDIEDLYASSLSGTGQGASPGPVCPYRPWSPVHKKGFG